MKIQYILVLALMLSPIGALIGQEKELPPQGGTPKNFTLPAKEVVEFDNGLKLVMVPYGAIPKATIHPQSRQGALRVAQRTPGTS